MKKATENIEKQITLMLGNFSNGACTIIVNGADGSIPTSQYKDVVEMAKKLALTHRDWPIGVNPRELISWDSTHNEIIARTETK